MAFELDLWAVEEKLWAPKISVPVIAFAFSHLEAVFTPKHKILELGSGYGQVAGFIGHTGARTIGIDVNSKSLAYAYNHYPNANFLQANAEVLPFDDSSLDGIFCYSTLQYTCRNRVLEECARILKPNGRFAFVENLMGNPIAKAFRAWAKFSKHRHNPFQYPKQHLQWSERHIYEQFFSKVECEVFYLTSPLLLSFRAIRNSSKYLCKSKWEHRLFSFINKFDNTVLRFTPVKHLAWLAVIYGNK